MHRQLTCHPETPAKAVTAVGFSFERRRNWLDLTYAVECPTGKLALPGPQRPYRAEGLWRRTCFELFLRDDGKGYREFNFSPSSQWAVHDFTAYREGMEAAPLDSPPAINLCDEGYALFLSVHLELREERSFCAAISAVIEEKDGTKSYWALAHPPGPPDFHHPDCFALELPAPEGP